MWRVLSVDDKEANAQNVKDALESWDDSGHGEIHVEIETSFERAVQRLNYEAFDFVVLDLHGATDPDPLDGGGNNDDQEGERLLEAMKQTRFIPVIFYSGFAEKISDLQSAVVRIVKKGENDVAALREAAGKIFETGIPQLLQKIEEEKRSYMWDTVDTNWQKIESVGATEDLAYLLARRLAARLSRGAIKDLLRHKEDDARPIEMYIYPPMADDRIKTGCVVRLGGKLWIIGTPACDFEQKKVDRVLLVGSMPLSEHPKFKKWVSAGKWNGQGEAPAGGARGAFDSLATLLRNGGGERYWFLPGTFFIDSILVDFQRVREFPFSRLSKLEVVCRVDSPFREELLLQLSRYYGRMGIPQLVTDGVLASFGAKSEIKPEAVLPKK